MADRIKGITIVIDGETQKLSDSLKKTNSDLKQTQNNLKDVNKLLKLDPGNVDLLKQKQELLSKAITDTKSKLDTERQALEQLKNADQTPEVKARQAALQREIVSTEQSLKSLKNQYKDFGSVAKQQLQAVSDKLGAAAEKTKKLSAVAAGAAGALIGNAIKAGQTADDINMLAQQYGVTTEEIQKMNYAQDVIDVSTETMLGSIAKLTKQMGAENDAFDKLGVKIKNADGSLRDSTDVWYDTLTALSKVENETERDALSMEIFGKSAMELAGIVDDGGKALKDLGNEAKKSGRILSQDALDSANRFNDSLDKLKATAGAAFLEAGATLAESLIPVIEKLSEVVSKALDWFGNLDGKTQTIILTVLGLVAAISPLLSMLSGLTMGLSMLMSPVGLVIAGIVALIAIGVALYKNWDTISAKAKELVDKVKARWEEFKTTTKATFASIRDEIVQKWNDIRQTVSDAVEAVRAAIQEKWDAIKAAVSNAVEAIRNKIAEVFSNIWNNVTNTWNAIKYAITHPIETAKATLANLVQQIKNLFNFQINLGNLITGNFSWAESLIDSLRSKISWLKSAASSAVAAVEGKAASVSSGAAHYSGKIYAGGQRDIGGIFTKPHIIEVAESRPEFVGALDDLRQIFREESARTNFIPTINIYGAQGQNINQLADVIMDRMQAVYDSRKQVFA